IEPVGGQAIGLQVEFFDTEMLHDFAEIYQTFFINGTHRSAKQAVSQSDASTLASASDNRWSKKMDFRNSSTCKLHQEPSTIESTASSLRRSFAKLKTFKPGGSKSDRNSHKAQRNVQELFQDDMSYKLTTDAIQARQMAFRREQTDLSDASVQRLIRHQHDESPHAHLRNPLKEFQQHENPTHCPAQKLNQPVGPIVPPHGKRIMDTNTMQKCIDELRQKRMQSSIIPPPRPKFDRQEEDSMNGSAGNHPFGQYEIVLRSRQKNLRPDHNRLSVPNLNDLSPDRMKSSANQDVTNSARALTTKLGRNPGTGELQTINEGLITPVIRRKQFSNSARTKVDRDSEANLDSQQISMDYPEISHQR
uniref:Uncharacterized protein n=1 Tax=Acrobeloides nanus TaxID=290746 RepID=A0A914CFA3_9BILA